MNYNMKGMEKTLPELFAILKTTELQIKKEHQVLMVNKTTTFNKKRQGGERELQEEWQASCRSREEAQGWTQTWDWVLLLQGEWSLEAELPQVLGRYKAGNINKGIFDIHVIDVYLTSAHSSAWVFDTGSVANICNSKYELQNKWRIAKDEVTMHVENGSKADVIAVGTLALQLPSGLVVNLNNCYLVPALSMNIISGSLFIARQLII